MIHETKHNSKLQIYTGMIQYILDTTCYTLKNIADFSGASLKTIRELYCDNKPLQKRSSELGLVRLYHIILELNLPEKAE